MNKTPPQSLGENDRMVHDLINSITSISLQCSMLRECPPGSVEAKERIEKIYTSCKQAQQHIKNTRQN